MSHRSVTTALAGIVAAAALASCGSMYYQTQERTISRRQGGPALTSRDGLPAGSTDQTVPPGTITSDGSTLPGYTPGSGVDPGTGEDGTPGTVGDKPNDTGCYNVDQFICEVELAIIARTNVYRNGMTPFRHNMKVSYAAREWSAVQASEDQLSHTGFPTDRYDLYTREFTSMGTVKFWAENVAYAFSGSARADDVALMFVNLWWESPPHRENMLGPYSVIGVGVYKSDPYYWATQIFGDD